MKRLYETYTSMPILRPNIDVGDVVGAAFSLHVKNAGHPWLAICRRYRPHGHSIRTYQQPGWFLFDWDVRSGLFAERDYQHSPVVEEPVDNQIDRTWIRDP